ncbi:tyrosine-type recombinase/integrase [Bacillus wiedmannii]|uniref:tyrosine-type recombinase/integrase n=1 Tax=Bacillus wiedmannii TaxID=1890302 RepID=UPI002732038E|nr:tyrosine-type recombinase/integrase [Bacillus wiedmannii]MDP1457907.1 tyrosine-type recombinase/integrase [Bacillus wiedmannii]
MNGTVKKNKHTGNWDFVFNIANDPMIGKRRQVRRRGFKSQQEAEDALIKLRADFLDDEVVNLSHMTYSAYMDEWVKERKIHLQKSTYETHMIYYRNIIKPKLGHFKLGQIEPIHIQKFINNLVSDTDYSPHTVHLVFRIISASLNKAKTMKLIKDTPATGTTLPRRVRKEINVWTYEQVCYFLEESRNVKRLTRCYVAFVMSILTGMRQGEIMGLRWRDIDFDKSVIYIRQTLTQAAEIKPGAKNASSVRSIHIPAKLIEVLNEHRNKIKDERIFHGRGYNDNDLVICTRDGSPMIPRNLRKEFYHLTEKLGLPKIRFHDLRHTHATLLIQQNVNVKLIAERLGHSDIETTLNTYSHVLPDMQKSVSDKLDKIF